MERTSKEEVNIPSIKEIRLERRRLARQNRKRRIFFNTTITWDGTNRTGVLTSLTGNQEDGKITFAPNDDKSELVTNVVNKKVPLSHPPVVSVQQSSTLLVLS